MTKPYRVLCNDARTKETHTLEFDDVTDVSSYASAMELMGMENIEKQYWQPAIGEWFRFHSNKRRQ